MVAVGKAPQEMKVATADVQAFASLVMAVEKTASKIRGMEQEVAEMVVEVTSKELTPRPTPP